MRDLDSESVGRRGRAPWLALLLVVASTWGAPAVAHETGASTLHLRVQDERVEGEWELTAADALVLLGASPDAVTLSPEQASSLAAVFLDRVRIDGDGEPCPLRIEAGPVGRSGEPPTVRLSISAGCPRAMAVLGIAYPMLFDLDPNHRAYYSLRDARHTQAGVFRPGQQEVSLRVEHPDVVRALREYGREGFRHVWGGIDHLLFLVSLLLPAVFGGRRRGRTSEGASSTGRAVALEVATIVTAFTLAHSVTLTLAALGVVRVPAQPVEVAIALSVLLAAWNNIRPWLRASPAWMALAFGLVHGLGFASALLRLGLPRGATVSALLGFNLGVEVGQLAVVALLLPFAYAARDLPAYRRWVVPGASLLIAWVAALWSVERAFGIELIPWI